MSLGGFSIMDDYLRDCQFVADRNGITSSLMEELCKPLRTIQFGVLGIGIIGLGFSVYALLKNHNLEINKN